MAASSSSSRSSSWANGDEKRHSPIPYRIGPLDYQLPVFCKCRKKAALWISWSDENPGCRYYKCFRARETDGCDFMFFYEGKHNSFVATLVVDLRDAVWNLKRQVAALKEDLQEGARKAEELEKELGQCKQEVAAGRFRGNGKEEEVQKLKKERFLLRALCVAMAALVVFMAVGN